MRTKVLALSELERSAASREIFAAVSSLPEFAAARTVAAYISLRDEPSTADFLRFAATERRIVVPRVEGEHMNFFEYRPEAMVRGAFGILEPASDAAPCAASDIDLMIVPGTSFTRDGRRMGRGGGYYDRYLAQCGLHAFTVGVCFGVQLSDDLPSEPHDRRVDMVITEL